MEDRIGGRGMGGLINDEPRHFSRLRAHPRFMANVTSSISHAGDHSEAAIRIRIGVSATIKRRSPGPKR